MQRHCNERRCQRRTSIFGLLGTVSTGCCSALVIFLGAMSAGLAADITVDLGTVVGSIRALNGINKGPLAGGGIIDLRAPLQALHASSVRLHDCHWPNPDVVDVHAVFPNYAADPAAPSSFDFSQTDEYIAATRQTGAEIIYRLGESIEHTSKKRFVHPPPDPAKWAAICLGIIRHYNEGWAAGHHYGIRYWEIWNEPENRPAMWTGSDADYFRLYRAAARAIASHDPKLKVGGPAVGYSGDFMNATFRPGAFVTNFLAFCRRESLPLDFFSWHCYSADPAEPISRARAIRRLLDSYGFTNAESHLNEWNYLPGNSWRALSRSSAPEERQRYYESMAGPGGAAYTAAVLVGLQDAPVDVCNFYHGELGGFGLFNDYGVPQKNYFALKAFAMLLETQRRVRTSGDSVPKLVAAAGLSTNGNRAAILISNFGTVTQPRVSIIITNAPWRSTAVEVRRVNAAENLDHVAAHTQSTRAFPIELDLHAPEVVIISLRRAD